MTTCYLVSPWLCYYVNCGINMTRYINNQAGCLLFYSCAMLSKGLVGKSQCDHSMVLLELNLSSVPMESNAGLGTRMAKLRPTRLSNDPINFGRRSQT